MKSRTFTWITATALLVAFTIALAAQPHKKLPRYTVIDLGTLGGTFSFSAGLSNDGLVEGSSTVSGDTAFHAFIWRDGVMTDLGTLGGRNSLSSFPPSERGEAGGETETSTSDPLGEDFCGFGTHLTCLPFVWRKGVMTPLPTLRGNNGAANEINDGGQVAGSVENAIADSTCLPPQLLDFEAVIWGPQEGEIQELPALPGDAAATAGGINDKGQAVGASGNCANSFLHALLWQGGTVTNLGNLGGTMNNVAADINNQGQVVGVSDLPGDTTHHAFLWQDGVMTDLGTLPGDSSSIGFGINSKGQVVGISVDASGNDRAFLWENGTMTDLNTLIPAGSPLVLLTATGTNNSRGQIAGAALEISTGQVHAFLATPRNGVDASETATAPVGETSQRPRVVLPENVRKMLEQRLRFGRFGRPIHYASSSAPAASPRPVATLSPTSMQFECRNVINAGCQCITQRTATLRNSGNATLSINKITITGPFSETNNCGTSLKAGSSCSISVHWSKFNGSGALSVFDNASGSPQQTRLSGVKFCTPL